jgi:hypothetical protein
VDGIRLLWLGVLLVGDEVGITVLGIDAEDRQAGAGDRASPQQRRPHHPRGEGGRTASPPRHRKAKKDGVAKAASDLAEAEAARAEEAAT